MGLIPLEEFRDLTEEINNSVSENLKTPITTFSSKFGVFANMQTALVQVKKMARVSVEKMQQMAPKPQIWTVREKQKPSLPEIAIPEPPAPVKSPCATYNCEIVGLNDIDFAFFDPEL